ncbi:MAG: FAD-dependent oxidoreductase [bacterium]|nr:FAD-dependent oxidoreductase [bacterium]
MTVYDLIIIGAGPAGITAGVYAARKRMNFFVISIDIGGQTAWSGNIENYTGYQFITGPELVLKFDRHMKQYGVDVRMSKRVEKIYREEDIIKIRDSEKEYLAKTVIIATGKKSKELNVPGEKEFKNKGLTYCATCDGPLFAEKDVAVIGGGNSALDAAIQLEKIANKVYIINIASELTADPVMRKIAEKNGKVTVFNKSMVTEITGDSVVKSIKFQKEGRPEEIAVRGVFVEIGLIPNSELAADVKKNDSGEIMVDNSNRTNIPGIFAAGDVTDVPEKQIIIAAGEGAKAAIGAFKYIYRGLDFSY